MITAYTVALFKPDAVRTRRVGDIVREIELHDLVVLEARLVVMEPIQAAQFYAEHEGRAFFDALIEFNTAGPLYTALLGGASGLDVVPRWRALMGPSDPASRPPHTIRGKWAGGCRELENLVHGSDSFDSARRESALLRQWGFLR